MLPNLPYFDCQVSQVTGWGEGLDYVCRSPDWCPCVSAQPGSDLLGEEAH